MSPEATPSPASSPSGGGRPAGPVGVVPTIRRHPVTTVVLTLLAAGAVVLAELVGLNLIIAIGLVVVVGLVALVVGRWLVGRRRGRPTGVVVASLVVAVVVVGLAIQAVPFGRAHSNGVVTGEPAWADARTRDLVVRACYDCHSNEVSYPWYASVAPVSWAVEMHVNQGRGAVNYSTFATERGAADQSVDVVLDGSMPPGYFTRFGLHPEAQLTDEELDELVAGLRATPGLSGDGD